MLTPNATNTTDVGCAECGKKHRDGWALYCVSCIELMGTFFDQAPTPGHAVVPIEPNAQLTRVLIGIDLNDPGHTARDRKIIVRRARARWAELLAAAAQQSGPARYASAEESRS